MNRRFHYYYFMTNGQLEHHSVLMESLLELSQEARIAAWKRCGRPCPEVFAGPMTTDPEFNTPAGNLNHQMIFTSKGTVLTTNGLSDPFDESWNTVPSQNGFKLELYYLTDEKVTEYSEKDLVIDETMIHDPHFGLMGQIEKMIVTQGGAFYNHIYDKGFVILGLNTPLLTDPEIANKFGYNNGKENFIMVMLGLTDPDLPIEIDGPLSKIRFVSFKVLTNDERLFIGDQLKDDNVEVAAAGQILYEKIQASPNPVVSSWTRNSVV